MAASSPSPLPTPGGQPCPSSCLARAGFVLAVLLSNTACDRVCVNGEAEDGSCILSDNGDPCNGAWDCNPASVCFSEVCVTDGVLRFSLSWTANTDFDLHVVTPDGFEIYWGQKFADGGYLDVDDCIEDECESLVARHVENIVWEEVPPEGTYTAWVENFSGSLAGSFELSVFGAGATRTEEGFVEDYAHAPSLEYTFTR